MRVPPLAYVAVIATITIGPMDAQVRSGGREYTDEEIAALFAARLELDAERLSTFLNRPESEWPELWENCEAMFSPGYYRCWVDAGEHRALPFDDFECLVQGIVFAVRNLDRNRETIITCAGRRTVYVENYTDTSLECSIDLRRSGRTQRRLAWDCGDIASATRY